MVLLVLHRQVRARANDKDQRGEEVVVAVHKHYLE
jgi:hypothetical protein